MHYPAQVAWYRRGARANGIDPKTLSLICVESTPPHPVVVLRLPENVLEMGDRLCTLWLERLRVCEESGQFPGYAQSPIDLELPAWVMEEEVGDG